MPPRVVVKPRAPEPSHDISLSSDEETIGLIYSQGVQFLQEIPISDPARPFSVTQKTWQGGRGRLRYQDDPSGLFDISSVWSMTEGKLFPVPQWRFVRGIRSADTDLPDRSTGLTWKALLGSSIYISRSFTASASYSADKAYLWVRRIGTPGTLTLKLHSNSSGDPSTTLKTVTKASTDVGDANDPTPPSVYLEFDWTTTESLTASTVYHLTVQGASTDNEANHWEVGIDSSGSASQVSTDGSNWDAGNFSMFFRVTDADTNRTWSPFYLDTALYIVSILDDKSATSQIFINGDRFKATGATSTTLTDTSSGVSTGWTTDEFNDGARVRIYEGTGEFQDRPITANTSTQLTVSPAFDTTPDTTSLCVIYNTDKWTEVTGHGLGSVVSKPALGSRVVYFPQGASVNIRRMRVDNTQANQHGFAADGTNRADILTRFESPANTLMTRILQATSAYAHSAIPAWGTNLTFGGTQIVGSNDYKVNNLYVAEDLYAWKEDSLWRFENYKPKRVKTGLDDIADLSNGKAVVVSPSGTWASWNHSIIRMLGADASDMLNYKSGYNGLPNDRKGEASSMVSVLGWLFVAIDGGTSNYSSVIAWNGFGWTEIFKGWATGKRIRNIFWQNNVNARPRLYIEIAGDLIYIEFPLRAANPLLDSGLAFQHEGHVITPTFDANEETLFKLFHSLKVVTENTNGKVDISYQVNDEVETNTWHVLGQLNSVSFNEFIINIGEAYSIRFRFRLHTESPSSPPIILSYTLDGWVTFPIKYQWVANFKVGWNQNTKNGITDFKPDDIVNFLRSASERNKKIILRSLKESMDDKIVVLSSPVTIMDSLTDDGWIGRVTVAMREA